jgi:hypothetical protein
VKWRDHKFTVKLGFFFFFRFFDRATARTAGLILMVNGSNDAVSRKEVPSDWGQKYSYSSSPSFAKNLKIAYPRSVEFL